MAYLTARGSGRLPFSTDGMSLRDKAKGSHTPLAAKLSRRDTTPVAPGSPRQGRRALRAEGTAQHINGLMKHPKPIGGRKNQMAYTLAAKLSRRDTTPVGRVPKV